MIRITSIRSNGRVTSVAFALAALKATACDPGPYKAVPFTTIWPASKEGEVTGILAQTPLGGSLDIAFEEAN